MDPEGGIIMYSNISQNYNEAAFGLLNVVRTSYILFWSKLPHISNPFYTVRPAFARRKLYVNKLCLSTNTKTWLRVS